MPSLPPEIPDDLLKALPRMVPIPPDGRSWTIAEPGRNYLAVASPGGPVRLDLTSASSTTTFSIRRLDAKTGRATEPIGKAIGGQISSIPAEDSGTTLLWLSPEQETRR